MVHRSPAPLRPWFLALGLLVLAALALGALALLVDDPWRFLAAPAIGHMTASTIA